MLVKTCGYASRVIIQVNIFFYYDPLTHLNFKQNSKCLKMSQVEDGLSSKLESKFGVGRGSMYKILVVTQRPI